MDGISKVCITNYVPCLLEICPREDTRKLQETARAYGAAIVETHSVSLAICNTVYSEKLNKELIGLKSMTVHIGTVRKSTVHDTSLLVDIFLVNSRATIIWLAGLLAFKSPVIQDTYSGLRFEVSKAFQSQSRKLTLKYVAKLSHPRYGAMHQADTGSTLLQTYVR